MTDYMKGQYQRPGYYWGQIPSRFSAQVTRFAGDPGGRTLLDLGAGEGRNTVYFAALGFDVLAIDLSASGLAKAEMLAAEAGVRIRTLKVNLAAYRPDGPCDVVFSIGTLHCLPRAARGELIAALKAATPPGGLHALHVFVAKPFVPPAPDADPGEVPFRSGELAGYYWDFEILDLAEFIHGCDSSGVPHLHAVNTLVARKPTRGSMSVW